MYGKNSKYVDGFWVCESFKYLGMLKIKLAAMSIILEYSTASVWNPIRLISYAIRASPEPGTKILFWALEVFGIGRGSCQSSGCSWLGLVVVCAALASSSRSFSVIGNSLSSAISIGLNNPSRSATLSTDQSLTI